MSFGLKRLKINNKGFFANVFTLLTGTIIAQAIPIVVSPILTRIYSPDDFGIFALYTSIISVIAVMANARYELAIMLPKKEEEAVNILALSIIVAAAISLLLFIIILLFHDNIALLLGNTKISNWLYFIPLSILLTGIYQPFNYWSNRKKQYKRLASNRMYQSTTTAGANLALGPIKDGAFGLIIGGIVSQLIATNRLIIKSIKEDNISIKDISFNDILKMMRRYDQLPKYSIGSGLLNSASVQLPIFILSSFFSGTVVGFYSLSHRVLNMPMSILGSAVAQVFFQTSAQLSNSDINRLKTVTYNTYKKILYIGVIPLSIVFAFGDYIFAFIFGSEWNIAGQYARLLSPWLLLVFVSSPLSNLFTVLEKQREGFLFNLFLFISRILSLLVGAVIFKDAFLTISLFGVTGFLFWLWHCLYILKLVGINYKKSFLFTCSLLALVFGVLMSVRYFLVGSII